MSEQSERITLKILFVLHVAGKSGGFSPMLKTVDQTLVCEAKDLSDDELPGEQEVLILRGRLVQSESVSTSVIRHKGNKNNMSVLWPLASFE